jgi:prophage tail gpP-like protein
MSVNVSLSVGGRIFTGWKDVEITRGLEQLAGTFRLESADPWSIRGETPPILEGMACTVKVYGQTVITGFVDNCDVSYDKESHGLTITGRDRAGDLVDCAAISEGYGILSQSLLQIAQALAKPFGISVSNSAGKQGTQAFEYQRINVGETIFECLARLAQIRGVLIVSDGLGGIQICQAGTSRARTPLQRPGNILACKATHSVAQRFHTYLVFGQGLDIDSSSASVVGSATDNDPVIRTARVTHVDPVEPTDILNATALAQWTANVRRAQGQRASYTVKGWQDGTGASARPWLPNSIVSIQDTWGRFQGSFLIAGVHYKIDEDEGEVATLDVVPRAAYSLIPHEEWNDQVYGAGAAAPVDDGS